MKYYDAWKHLKILKDKYPEVDLDKIEEKISRIRKSEVVVPSDDGGQVLRLRVAKSPGKLDIKASVNIQVGSQLMVKDLLFKGIKVKGAFSDILRAMLGMRISFEVRDMFFDGATIIKKD